MSIDIFIILLVVAYIFVIVIMNRKKTEDFIIENENEIEKKDYEYTGNPKIHKALMKKLNKRAKAEGWTTTA
jgi:regulatory protein YycI of two-component signal transduction system YycFG